MTDQDQTPAPDAPVAQDAPAAAPAPEVAPVAEAAPEPAPEPAPAPVEEPAPAPVEEPAPAPVEVPSAAFSPAAETLPPAADPAPDETVEIDITETIVIHNPAALRGVAAGPADHPRVLAARAAAENQ